jgi:Na+-driven multidrug efflux pump
MARTAPGVGVRHLNDYAGTIIPLMFIGTIGVKVLASVVVAAKIYTMICRVPQACFSGTFVFYGYALGASRSTDLADTIRKLRLYAAVPTAVVTLATLALSPWLVGMFATDGLDQDMARYLLFAYLLYMPAYFFEQFYGEMLTVHQRGGLLFSASTVVTYLLTVPMAWYALFVLESPFLAVASKGLSTAVLALMFWFTLRKDQWDVVRLA